MDRHASFQVFADAHQHRLMRLAYLLTGEVHLAEDLLQSVLVRMYGRWPKLRHIDRPEAYARPQDHGEPVHLVAAAARRGRGVHRGPA